MPNQLNIFILSNLTNGNSILCCFRTDTDCYRTFARGIGSRTYRDCIIGTGCRVLTDSDCAVAAYCDVFTQCNTLVDFDDVLLVPGASSVLP